MSLEIAVLVNVEVYEVNSQAVPHAESKKLTIRSASNSSFVEIDIGGQWYAVSGRDLRAAVSRCERDV